jgi:hypothetical protein|mmetsp:Transcript_9991/g.22144  ORF Transcript_9991/g.22144 Transcript_9991/m.22144 type:complete len:82 (+) Transcript_9991:526-771(+)
MLPLKKSSFNKEEALGLLDGSLWKHFAITFWSDEYNRESSIDDDDFTDGSFGESSLLLRWKNKLRGFLNPNSFQGGEPVAI